LPKKKKKKKNINNNIINHTTINLVEKDDCRLHCQRLVKQQAQLALGLADPFGQTIGALHSPQKKEKKEKVDLNPTL